MVFNLPAPSYPNEVTWPSRLRVRTCLPLASKKTQTLSGSWRTNSEPVSRIVSGYVTEGAPHTRLGDVPRTSVYWRALPSPPIHTPVVAFHCSSPASHHPAPK